MFSVHHPGEDKGEISEDTEDFQEKIAVIAALRNVIGAEDVTPQNTLKPDSVQPNEQSIENVPLSPGSRQSPSEELNLRSDPCGQHDSDDSGHTNTSDGHMTDGSQDDGRSHKVKYDKSKDAAQKEAGMNKKGENAQSEAMEEEGATGKELSQSEWHLLFELMRKEHEEQMSCQKAQHEEQLQALLKQQKEWLIENVTSTPASTPVKAHPPSGLPPDFQVSPLGKAVRQSQVEVTPQSSPQLRTLDSPRKLPMAMAEELSPEVLPISRVSQSSKAATLPVSHQAAIVSGHGSHSSPVKSDREIATMLDQGRVNSNPALMSPDDPGYMGSPPSGLKTNVEKYDRAGLSPEPEPKDASFSYFDESAKERLLQRSINRSLGQDGSYAEHSGIDDSRHTPDPVDEQRRLMGVPADNKQWLHEVQVPYSPLELSAGAILRQQARQDKGSPTANQEPSLLLEDDGNDLQQQLKDRHTRRLAEIPNTPSQIQGRQSEEAEFISNVRLNLREKHARHLSDLREFYEKEVADLKQSLLKQKETGSGGGQELHELQDAYERTTHQVANLETELLLANSNIERLKQNSGSLEASLMDWQRKSEDFEVQLLETRHRFDELQLYSQEREGYVQRLEQQNQQLTAQLQEAAKLDDLRTESMKRDQAMMQKVVKDYEHLRIENDALKAKLNSTENLLYDANKENGELKRTVNKLELESRRLGRENDLMRHKGLSPSVNLPMVQMSLEETANLLEKSTTPRSSYASQPRVTAQKVGPVISPTNYSRISAHGPAYPSLIGISPLRPQTANGRISNQGIIQSEISPIYNGSQSERSEVPSFLQLDSSLNVSAENLSPRSPRKAGDITPQLSTRSPQKTRMSVASDIYQQTEEPGGSVDLSPDHSPPSSSRSRASQTFGGREPVRQNSQTELEFDESVVSALQKVRSGSIVTEDELKLACSHNNSVKAISRQPEPKSKPKQNSKQQQQSSQNQKLTDHMRMISDLEHRFEALTVEKRKVESALSRIPTAGTGAGKHHARQEQEQLEGKLDRIDKDLGSVRMKLRQHHAL